MTGFFWRVPGQQLILYSDGEDRKEMDLAKTPSKACARSWLSAPLIVRMTLLLMEGSTLEDSDAPPDP